MSNYRCAARLMVGLTFVLVVACSAPPAPRVTSGSDGDVLPAPRSTAPKVLTWAGLRELASFEAVIGLGGSGSPASEVTPVVHNFLVIDDHRFDAVPQLAVERPSVERGTWRVHADGSMATTWRIHPNVKWHDGRPFTSADLLFSFAASIDPDLPKSQLGGLRYMASAEAPDAHTFVINWSSTYAKADREVGLAPLPAHLLEAKYRADKNELLTDLYFTTAFVGLGAYRLAKWEPGSHIEFARFDDYFLGRPSFDTVIVRFIGDPTTMLSNALAGAVDVATPFLTANLDAVLEVRERWAGTANRVVIGPTDGLRHLQLQFRPGVARPSGMLNPTVRQALYAALDRQAIVDVMTRGTAPVADSYMPPVEPMRPQVESAIPQYPYDPQRAQQLLAQAGWARGSDGTLIHQASGERFEIEVWGRPGSASETELNIIADNWKAVGAAPRVSMVPVARVTDRELLATYPAVLLHNPPWFSLYENRLHSRDIANDANRWSGRNAAGYSNARVDPLLDQLLTSIEPRQQVALHRQLLQEVMTDVAFMPLYYVVRPVLVLGTVRGEVTPFATGWNIFTWDKES